MYAFTLSEYLCITTSCVIWVITAALFVSKALRAKIFGGDGDFSWQALRSEHISHGLPGWSPGKVAAVRLLFAGFALSTACDRTFQGIDGREPTVDFPYTFTGWCWMVMGIYFLGAGLASLKELVGLSDKPVGQAGLLSCSLWVLFQVSFSCSFLIFFIVWCVLIPQNYVSYGMATVIKDYFNFDIFCAHNLNVVFMLVEGSMNRLTFVRSHMLFAAMYGNIYIVFSWFHFMSTGVFYYFFVDWQKMATPAWYLFLLAMLCIAFVGGSRLMGKIKKDAPGDLLPTTPDGIGVSSTLLASPVAIREDARTSVFV